MNLNLKNIINKFVLILLISFTFIVLFKLEVNLLGMVLMSVFLAVINILVGNLLLGVNEKVINHLYAICIFITNMVFVNFYFFVKTGLGASNQTIVFYFALVMTILLTIIEFYKPKRSI